MRVTRSNFGSTPVDGARIDIQPLIGASGPDYIRQRNRYLSAAATHIEHSAVFADIAEFTKIRRRLLSHRQVVCPVDKTEKTADTHA